MKTFNNIFSILCFCLPINLGAVPDVSLQINRFMSGTQSFAEISIYVVGSSITCKEMFKTHGVDYVVIIKNKSGEVVAGDHFKLVNEGCPAKDLIDAKRFALTAGSYVVDVEFTDILDTVNNIRISQEVEIPVAKGHLSDVQLLSVIRQEPESQSALHKHGLYLEPLPFDYYYPELNELSVYVETYQADAIEGQPYIQYTISPLQGDLPSPIVAYRKVGKQPAGVNIFQLNIGSLISGTYKLEAALFDGNKKQLESRLAYFSRYNPVGDSIFLASGALNMEASFIGKIPSDSLDYYLKSMVPIVNSIDVDVMNGLLKRGDDKAKRFFIHRFWTTQAGKFADQAFNAYAGIAKAIDEAFGSGFGYGFETDRGHIFLKYGRPDDVIEVEDEPSAPPYEIWFYNNFPATHQTNIRFLFYNPSLAKNAFKLLHSTAIGEVKNERWEVELYRDATQETPEVGTKVMGENVHRNARRYFEN